MQDEKDSRLAAINETMKQLEKQFGKGAIMRLGEEADHQMESLPTGSLSLDIALGIGGYPKGRIIEIYGPESSGKTTLALHAIASSQKLGGYVAFIDAEHALDPLYARNLGIDIDNLLLSQPDSGEQALQIAEALIKSSAIDVIVVDSVAALVPESELNANMGDVSVGNQARLMSQAMRKLSGILSKTNTTIIFINQIRDKIGVMFGNPETTTGGKALKFYSSVRLEIRKSDSIKNGAEIIGNKVTIKVVKNKVAPPFKSVSIDLIYGKGFPGTGEVVDLASDLGIIVKSGAWFSYEGEKIGQGRDNVKIYLEERVDLLNKIKNQILDHYGFKR
ncbi:MAG: recombinase RecA [Acholeplasmatales bacterium]|nr:recombinase RecA [Acholeplasmatales bacterium]